MIDGCACSVDQNNTKKTLVIEVRSALNVEGELQQHHTKIDFKIKIYERQWQVQSFTGVHKHRVLG